MVEQAHTNSLFQVQYLRLKPKIAPATLYTVYKPLLKDSEVTLKSWAIHPQKFWTLGPRASNFEATNMIYLGTTIIWYKTRAKHCLHLHITYLSTLMLNTIKQQALLQVAAAWPCSNHTELHTRSLITCKYNKDKLSIRPTEMNGKGLNYERNWNVNYKIRVGSKSCKQSKIFKECGANSSQRQAFIVVSNEAWPPTMQQLVWCQNWSHWPVLVTNPHHYFNNYIFTQNIIYWQYFK